VDALLLTVLDTSVITIGPLNLMTVAPKASKFSSPLQPPYPT